MHAVLPAALSLWCLLQSGAREQGCCTPGGDGACNRPPGSHQALQLGELEAVLVADEGVHHRHLIVDVHGQTVAVHQQPWGTGHGSEQLNDSQCCMIAGALGYVAGRALLAKAGAHLYVGSSSRLADLGCCWSGGASRAAATRAIMSAYCALLFSLATDLRSS